MSESFHTNAKRLNEISVTHNNDLQKRKYHVRIFHSYIIHTHTHTEREREKDWKEKRREMPSYWKSVGKGCARCAPLADTLVRSTLLKDERESLQ